MQTKLLSKKRRPQKEVKVQVLSGINEQVWLALSATTPRFGPETLNGNEGGSAVFCWQLPQGS